MRIILATLAVLVAASALSAGERKVLLLGQGPDGHPPGTHEYLVGLDILKGSLERASGIDVRVVRVDEPWRDGPAELNDADAVVLYLAEGARWLHRDPAQLAAFRRFAARGGGLVGLHWAIGCRDAEYIDPFVSLFGGCHGGPDRKYAIVRAMAIPAKHSIARGIEPFLVRDEFYYALKLAPGAVPVLKVPIAGAAETVAWAWERPDGGRSAGFSGAHFHGNWELTEYRTLATQAVLWTLGD